MAKGRIEIFCSFHCDDKYIFLLQKAKSCHIINKKYVNIWRKIMVNNNKKVILSQPAKKGVSNINKTIYKSMVCR